MLFNSLHFLVFFGAVLCLFYALPIKYRAGFLLIASIYFYSVLIPIYLLILAFIILLDFCMALLIYKSGTPHRKVYLWVSLSSNLGILCFFKYYNFFLSNINAALNVFDISANLPFLEILLPIGLSFHTFQAMAYIIEVYKSNYAPERNLIRYSLYVMFFPQLVAGPIERPKNLLPQLRFDSAFSTVQFRRGMLLVFWGLLKKSVIADRLAPIVDQFYSNIWAHGTGQAWIAIIAYSFQIYCDFSGYSDIAIGTAGMLGVQLSENFKNPYLSTSLTEFWRRWHITLSGWFRDYIYIPLGGKKNGNLKFIVVTLFVFALSGLWHGAKNTFIVWGLIHGIFLVLEKLSGSAPSLPHHPLEKLTRILYVFFISTFAWVFFRSSSVEEAVFIIKKLFSLQGTASPSHYLIGEYILILGVIALLLAGEKGIKNFPAQYRKKFYPVLFAIVLTSYFFGIFHSKTFIYFQF